MEPVTVKVPAGSTLDHHHGNLENGFQAPGTLHNARAMQRALERHMNDGDMAEHHEHF